MSPILECIRNKKTTNKTIWLMRQAGRYLPEFREIRKKNPDFIKLCLNPDLATEITLQPLKRFDLDAAIIFSDILMIPYGLGQKVNFKRDFGPELGSLNVESVSKIDEIDFIDKRLKSDIKNSLFTLSQDLGAIPCHLVNTDFNPGNILVNKNSTTIIDWEKTEENGLIFWMASTFLRYIDRYSGRFGTSRKKVDLFKKSFLHTYLSNSIFKEHKLLFSVVYALENLTYISETTVYSNKPSRIQKNSLNEILRTLEIAKS